MRQDPIPGMHRRAQSRRDAFADPLPMFLRVRGTGSAVHGKANDHRLRWRAKRFGISRVPVTLKPGATRRSRLIRIQAPGPTPVRGIDRA